MNPRLRIPLRLVAVAIVVALTWPTGACAPTDTAPTVKGPPQTGAMPAEGQSLVILGLGMEVVPTHHSWSFSFVAYDPEREILTPRGFELDVTQGYWPEVARPEVSDEFETRVYSLPAGAYMYQGPLLEGLPTSSRPTPSGRDRSRGIEVRAANKPFSPWQYESKVFEVRAGEAYFLGDFVLVGERIVDHRPAPERIAGLAERFGVTPQRIRPASFELTAKPWLHFTPAR